MNACFDRRAPFFLPGGKAGVLLVHGFLSAPGEMRGLGRHLSQTGMTVRAIRLRGHGRTAQELAGVPWQAWVEDVQRGLDGLRTECREVSLAGLSLGAALALYVAAHEPVERVVGERPAV